MAPEPAAASPLAGRRVLVARARGQADELLGRIEALGGVAVHAPVLVIAPGDEHALDAAVRTLDDGAYVALCLTSPNGVDALADAMQRAGVDTAALDRLGTLACVGPGTARALAERLGRTPGLLPPAATTRALAEAFPPGAGDVLLPRADIASAILPAVLVEKGYRAVEVVAYRTVAPPALADDVLADLSDGRIDVVAFGSSSTVRHFVALTSGVDWRARVASIGPVTSATCAELGIRVDAEADPHDLDGLVDAIVRAAR